MDESLFQHIGSHCIAAWLRILALAAPAAGLLLGAGLGARRKRLARGAVIGLLCGAVAPMLLCAWHLVEARTSFHRRLYSPAPDHGPVLWRLFPPPEHYAACERARYGPHDPVLRQALPPSDPPDAESRPWWRLVPPDRLDSVANVVLLAVVFALAGLAAGLLGARLLRRPAAGTAHTAGPRPATDA